MVRCLNCEAYEKEINKLKKDIIFLGEEGTKWQKKAESLDTKS